jgi:hypothetical protein
VLSVVEAIIGYAAYRRQTTFTQDQIVTSIAFKITVHSLNTRSFCPLQSIILCNRKKFLTTGTKLVLVGLHSYHPYPANLFLHNLYYVLLKTSGVTLRAGVAQLG